MQALRLKNQEKIIRMDLKELEHKIQDLQQVKLQMEFKTYALAQERRQLEVARWETGQKQQALNDPRVWMSDKCRKLAGQAITAESIGNLLESIQGIKL